MGYLDFGQGIVYPAVDGPSVLAAGLAFPIIGLFILAGRLACNIHKRNKPGLADIFGVISWICLLGQGIVLVWSEQMGVMGYPTPLTAPKSEVSAFFSLLYKTEYIVMILLVLTLGTTKLSLLFFIRRIFVVERRTLWDLITIGLVVIVSLWTISYALAFTLLCGAHPTAFWGPSAIKAQYCLPTLGGGEAAVEMSAGITDTVLDLVCLMLPFAVLYQIKLKLSYRIGVSAIFCIGFMTLGAAIARLILWMKVDTTPVLPDDLDISLAITVCLWWGMLESGLAFSASQLPALSPLLPALSKAQLYSSLRQLGSKLSLASSKRSNSSSSNVVDSGNHVGSSGAERATSWKGKDKVDARTQIHYV